MNFHVIYQTSRHCPDGNCVEAGVLPDGAISVRDSKDRDKPAHVFTREEWDAFVAGVKDGQFDFAEDAVTAGAPVGSS